MCVFNRLCCLIFIFVLLATLVATLPPAQAAERRIALLIGNQGYTAKVGPLKNPFNDVELVRKSLAHLGFEVTVIKDAGYRKMSRAIKRHVETVREAGRGAISFFYYTGHGVANPKNKINYLIPVDVADADDASIWFNSFKHSEIVKQLVDEASSATHFVVFDACRNELNLTGPRSKSVAANKGMVPIRERAGILIAFATAPNHTASDSGQGGGTYAKILADELIRPGVEAVAMFRNVQIRVQRKIGQNPWLSLGSLPPIWLAGAANIKREGFIPPPSGCTSGVSAFVKGETRCLSPKESFRDCTSCPEMVTIPQGSFAMGTTRSEIDALVRKYGGRQSNVFFFNSETPQHKVTIPQPFGLGRYPVTRSEYSAFIKATPSHNTGGGCVKRIGATWQADPARSWQAPGFTQYDRDPVVCVNHADAKAYAGWLSGKTGVKYRLPSEAELEYAALGSRTGAPTRYHFGNREGDLCTYANVADQTGNKKHQWQSHATCDDGETFTSKVGSFLPNDFGLYDMHGNVWNLVADCWHDTFKGAPSDGSAWTTACGPYVVRRGGSWQSPPEWSRLSTRSRHDPALRGNATGFRVARDL